MEKEIEEYKGFKISFDTYANKFVGKSEDRYHTSKEYQTLIKAIDRANIEKKDFKRFIAYKEEGWGGHRFIEVDVTSLTESQYGSKRAWIVYKEGNYKKKEKVCINNLILKTPESTKVVEKYKQLLKDSEALKTTANTLIQKYEMKDSEINDKGLIEKKVKK